MKRTKSFICEAFKWCASKCRALLGAIDFMLPDDFTSRIRGMRRSFPRVALLLMALFLLIGPVFFRPTREVFSFPFVCPVKFRPSCYSSEQPLTSTNFTYTGSYVWVPESGSNYRLKFLTSGTFTPQVRTTIDVFLVGGGAGGGQYANNSQLGGGGAGGYAGTYLSYTLVANQAYSIVIGAGGGAGGNGGSSTGFGYTKGGGTTGGTSASSAWGGSGGSGGGTGSNGTPGAGGANGANGGGGTPGAGQGTTTYEFGDASLTLYSGAGGGGKWDGAGGAGGAGGGGRGSGAGAPPGTGTTNLGGGGGGRGDYVAAAGGSGIVVIRNHR